MISLYTKFCVQVQIYLKDEFLEVLTGFGIEQILNKKPVSLQRRLEKTTSIMLSG